MTSALGNPSERMHGNSYPTHQTCGLSLHQACDQNETSRLFLVRLYAARSSRPTHVLPASKRRKLESLLLRIPWLPVHIQAPSKQLKSSQASHLQGCRKPRSILLLRMQNMKSSQPADAPSGSSTNDSILNFSPPSPSSSFAIGDEEAEGLLGEKSLPQRGSNRQHVWTRTTIAITVVNVVLFSISLALFSVSWIRRTQLNAELRQASTYSPFFDKLDLEMVPRMIQGTLFPAMEGASIARELPNPTADELWEEWELSPPYPLTRGDIVRMGKDPSTVPKLEDAEWGLGNDAYVGAFDVYHQIHCLNSLRRNAYGGYYNLTARNHKAMGLPEIHINHCVDILLQALQCSGNVNFITYHWVAGQEYPQPDMSINRQCINFEKLTAFRKENGVDLDKYARIMKKSLHPGVKERHQSDAYYKYYHKTNPNHINGANPGEDFNL
ncbi:hypothetical protein AAE478_001035 [Parahypoxylon ruwenzoriense]